MDFTEKIKALATEYLALALHLVPTEEEFVTWVDGQALTPRPLL